jgi:lipoprotein-anchoring transpeptidase ErfK/SrfK
MATIKDSYMRHILGLAALFLGVVAFLSPPSAEARQSTKFNFSSEPQASPAPPRQALAERRSYPRYRRTSYSYFSSYGGRSTVPFKGRYAKGSIIIDTSERALYYVTGKGQAIRYGVGVGRQGFQWAGVNRISRKAVWPSWRPPALMRKRQPGLPVFMPGGPRNPLGARALYIGSTLFRIHGTNERHTIGRAVSSGCIRLLNEDVIDLYNRVRVGALVVVRH